MNLFKDAETDTNQLRDIDEALKRLENVQRGRGDQSSPSGPLKYRDILGDSLLSNFEIYIESHEVRISISTGESFLDHLQDLLRRIKNQRQAVREDTSSDDDKDFDNIDIFPNVTTKARKREMSQTLVPYAAPIAGILYSIARLTIIALAISSLRAMPSGVYQTTWSDYLPKLG